MDHPITANRRPSSRGGSSTGNPSFIARPLAIWPTFWELKMMHDADIDFLEELNGGQSDDHCELVHMYCVPSARRGLKSWHKIRDGRVLALW